MDSYSKISSDQLRERQKKGQHFLLIDLRSAKEYENEHVADSINIPWENLQIKELTKSHPEKQIVLICSSTKVANMAAAVFFAPGQNNVFVLKGGMLSWRVLGLPLVRSKN